MIQSIIACIYLDLHDVMIKPIAKESRYSVNVKFIGVLPRTIKSVLVKSLLRNPVEM